MHCRIRYNSSSMMFFRMNTHVLGTLILVVFLLQKGHPLQQQQQQQQQEANRELIVGGAQEAPLDFYNWFVRVKNRAGVLIAPQFFITKANYADTIVPKETLSRIGFLCNEDDDITSSTTNCGQYYEDKMVEKIFIHPDYDNGGPNLMLVQLNETSTIQPSKMDHGKLALSYQTGQGNLFTAGFGTTNVETGAMSDRLLHLEQHFLSNDECIQAVIDESGWNITHQEMCAANQDPLKSPCYYDGGGPLYDVTAQKLVGIVSTGADGCQDYPTVYERIGTVYEDWIKETICREHVEPKPSFCMEQDQHFNVVSEFKEDDDDDGQSWCLTRRDAGEGAQVVVEVCKESEHQLWNINGRGQMRSFHNKKLCMTNIKGEKKFAMKPCPKRKGNSNFTFIFDPIHNSLIWLSNKANFKRWGLRAVALLDIPSVDDEISKSVHVRKRNDDILQKWRIEYPDM